MARTNKRAEIKARLERLLDQGLDEAYAHPRALELAPEPFFWDCVDELAPFGSDEGHTALEEFLDWRKERPTTQLLTCLRWVIENVGEMRFADYNVGLLDKAALAAQLRDPNYDDQQYVYTLDVSVYATGFAQLVLEGTIDVKAKPTVQLALDRQRLYAEVSAEHWKYAADYSAKLQVLGRVLEAA